MALDNPLWRYALALYAQPGVEQCCLQLQEQGAAINRLLLACWLGRMGVAVDHDRWQLLDTEWRQAITEPLRQIRYRVRERRTFEPEVEACYQALRQAELAAEQIELLRLWRQARDWLAQPEVVGKALMLDNLISYRHSSGQPLEQSCLRQLALAAAELPVEESELSSGPGY
ncbi:TIGR02444 family protein [Marinobacterium sediminicola]|uniref:TIGR02444 family protein n=1 Tax=Marinobacterium sediminicola TaxID=518898 RepID=A0ABY1S1F2_9GAMM|nr:TIGR02444 family protein [Marinobacterium sediminicola]ULG69333.1 TIGR02444 family protein [Marinobacterium sediminicola]SMR75478.1 TIGR02444 family protein [Marinobacterium sediminicola]